MRGPRCAGPRAGSFPAAAGTIAGPGCEVGRAGARHPVLYAAALVRMAITGPALQRRTCDSACPRGIASRRRAPAWSLRCGAR